MPTVAIQEIGTGTSSFGYQEKPIGLFWNVSNTRRFRCCPRSGPYIFSSQQSHSSVLVQDLQFGMDRCSVERYQSASIKIPTPISDPLVDLRRSIPGTFLQSYCVQSANDRILYERLSHQDSIAIGLDASTSPIVAFLVPCSWPYAVPVSFHASPRPRAFCSIGSTLSSDAFFGGGLIINMFR